MDDDVDAAAALGGVVDADDDDDAAAAFFFGGDVDGRLGGSCGFGLRGCMYAGCGGGGLVHFFGGCGGGGFGGDAALAGFGGDDAAAGFGGGGDAYAPWTMAAQLCPAAALGYAAGHGAALGAAGGGGCGCFGGCGAAWPAYTFDDLLRCCQPATRCILSGGTIESMNRRRSAFACNISARSRARGESSESSKGGLPGRSHDGDVEGRDDRVAAGNSGSTGGGGRSAADAIATAKAGRREPSRDGAAKMSLQRRRV